MDVRALAAAQTYADLKPATRPAEPAGEATRPAADFATLLSRAEETAMAAMAGDADPHALIQALAQTELAVETAVTIRNRVVEAYQEILRMPV